MVTELLRPDQTAVADYIHLAKYARYRPELGRRELYHETVQRVEDMHVRRYPQIVDRIHDAFDFVRAKRVLPSMRSMQFGGDAVEKVHLRSFNCSASYCDRPRFFQEAMYLLLCGAGVGFSVQFEHVEKLPPLVRIDEDRVKHHTVADTIEGWADAFGALMMAYFKYGHYVEFNFSKIRGRGRPLKTSGGRAPGHLPLKRALYRIRAILNDAQGRQLRPIECFRIMCLAADAVLSGGIRRSAMLALFSPDDGEMITAKTGEWYKNYPEFANANISCLFVRSDVKKGTFRRAFMRAKEWGEPGNIFANDINVLFNPCQPGFATVLTPEGIRTFDEIDVGSMIWSGKRWTKVINKVETGIKEVNAYHTRAGVFYGTENHRVVESGVKIEVGRASAIDTSLGPVAGVSDLDPQDVMDGLMLGDGVYHKAGNSVFLVIDSKDVSYHDSEIAHLILEHCPEYNPHYWSVKTTLNHLPRIYDREIPERFLKGDSRKVRGFLRGLFTANGSVVEDRITLKATSFKVISGVQQMLSSLGIPSHYTRNKGEEVKSSNGTYRCRDSYDLNITGGLALFGELIGFIQPYKMDCLAEVIAGQIREGRAPKSTYEITEIVNLGEMPVYDITVDAPEHTYWTGGHLVSNCGEASFRPMVVVDEKIRGEIGEFFAARNTTPPRLVDGDVLTGWGLCNLSEINVAAAKTPEDFYEACRAATVIGTCQAGYTDYGYLGWVTEFLCRKEALIGVGMTGMSDNPSIAFDPEILRRGVDVVLETNREIAAMIGINPAARCTLVKPSGTGSLALGCVGSGIHGHPGFGENRRYFRRITATEGDPVFEHFRAINPHMCEPKNNERREWVITFPVEAPDGSILSGDQSAVDFLSKVLLVQKNWVIPGTARPDVNPNLNHNVSNTVLVGPDEWEAALEFIWANRAHFAGVSVLPRIGDKLYKFAPREVVTTEADEAKWNYLILNYKPVDYTALIEDEDTTEHTAEVACSGGACMI